MFRWLIPCLLWAVPVAAFTPPAGCSAHLNAQYSSCLMMVTWTCEGDAEGDRWSALIGEDGLRRIRRLDHDYQWLETYYFPSAIRSELQPDTPDPASLTTLLETGYDSYDFTIVLDDGRLLRYVGHDRLTGEEVSIDGVTLQRTEFAYQRRDENGTILAESSGSQYVSADLRLFFFGETVDAQGVRRLDEPVRLIAPGQPGFLASEPVYGCGGLTS